MKLIILDVNNEDFIVHFDKQSENWFNGRVIQICMFSDGTWQYQSNTSSDTVDNIEDARVWFEWSFCWRGVWEGRIYFKDEEYWSQELKTIALVWERVEAIAKELIRVHNPEDSFDD